MKKLEFNRKQFKTYKRKKKSYKILKLKTNSYYRSKKGYNRKNRRMII